MEIEPLATAIIEKGIGYVAKAFRIDDLLAMAKDIAEFQNLLQNTFISESQEYEFNNTQNMFVEQSKSVQLADIEALSFSRGVTLGLGDYPTILSAEKGSYVECSV